MRCELYLRQRDAVFCNHDRHWSLGLKAKSISTAESTQALPAGPPPPELTEARAEVARLRQALSCALHEIAQLQPGSPSSGHKGTASPLGGGLRIRETLDHLLEGCQILGFDYSYLYINDAAERHNRRSKTELMGRRFPEMWPGIEQTEVFRLIQDCMQTRQSHAMENEFTFPDGEVGYFELRIQPVPDGVFILSLNITERRRAELEREALRKQLRQAQTMEAVGRLSGGLAHDFNNMLAVILSESELVLDELGSTHPLAADLERIQDSAQHCAELIGQLLAIARRQASSPQVLDLNAAISRLFEMLRRLFSAPTTLSFRPDPGLWPLYIDPSQVDRLLVNLVLNARDAIRGAGHVTISTANVRGEGAERADCVRLCVEDDGEGMDAETQERMFEPFFTTKQDGEGTGLGLATVYGLVKQNGARIDVWSERGRGTRMTIDFPRRSALAEQPRQADDLAEASAEQAPKQAPKQAPNDPIALARRSWSSKMMR